MKQPIRSASWLLALVLAAITVRAQTAPPVLNNPPAPGNPPPQAAPALESADDPLLLGRAYRVETVTGTTFTGTLVSMSLAKLGFDTPDMGHVELERSQIRRVGLQGPLAASTRPGYFDIGNGNRLFFGPTGRGLRKGENSLQTVNLFLIGGNFGVTKNLSLGGYITVIPGLGLGNQFLLLTPKLSFPVSEKVHAGAGVLYLRIPDFSGLLRQSYGAGILYGAATYGSADDNVTAGLGYGFFEREIGSTPVLMLGGQKRVSRRISLVSENYIVADSRAGMGGLYGIKINWLRTTLGLGAFYAVGFGYDETYTTYYYPPAGGPPTTVTQTRRVNGSSQTSYILPVYYDFTFRFGKGSK